MKMFKKTLIAGAVLAALATPSQAARTLCTVVLSSSGASCSSTSVPTDSCLLATVSSCQVGLDVDGNSAAIASTTASVKVSNPTGTPIGTVILFAGGNVGGWWDGFTGADVMTPLLAAIARGQRVIQVAFNQLSSAPALTTGTAGSLALYGRLASVIQAIHDNANGFTLYNAGTAFVVGGQSGGASGVGYAMAHYGGHLIIDTAIFFSGPPHTDLEAGTFGNQNLPWLAVAPSYTQVAYIPTNDRTGVGGYLAMAGETGLVDPSYGSTTPFTSRSSAGGIGNSAGRNSILKGDATVYWPQTDAQFVFCNRDNSVAPALGEKLRLAITSTTTKTIVTQGIGHNHTDCPQDGQGTLNTILSNATFRH